MEVRRRNRLPEQQDDRRDYGDSAEGYGTARGHLDEAPVENDRHSNLPC